MKNYKIIFFSLLFFGFAAPVFAITPALSLTNVNATSGQVTVYGDANSSVTLYYGTTAALQSVALGITDLNGVFSTPVSVSSYNISCGKTAYVSVNNQQSQTISWTANAGDCAANSSSSPYFSKNNLTLNVGLTDSVNISGTGGYYISNNTNSNVISANISGDEVDLRAVSFGISKITICESDGDCADLNVTAVSVNAQQYSNINQKPTITSLSVFSNNNNGEFVSAGNTLTFGFNFNKPVSGVSVAAGYARPAVAGTGSGTYMATYVVGSNENSSIPVTINFTDSYGNLGQYSFTLSNIYVAPAPVATPPIITVTPTNNQKYVFTSFLTLNSKGDEVSQLQKRMTELGFYSGPITGTFGALTESAVKKLQKAYNIAQAGYVGPATRAILN